MTMSRLGLVVSVATVFLIVFAVLFTINRSARTAPPPPPAIEVPVTPVVEQTVPVYLEYVGATDAIRIVTLQAQITGYLMKRLVPDGSDVQAGELLYQIDTRTYQAALDQAKALAEQHAAALAYARESRRRNVQMRKNGDVSVDTLQQSQSSEQQSSAALAADRAAIETAQINLDFTQIRAPFAGRLSLSLVHEGALISTAGTQLNTLVQLDPIYATFNPPDSDLAQIQAAQAKAPIPTDVIVGDGTTQYHGKVTFLDNTVGRDTGTMTIRATVDNPDHTLLPGQFIRVRLHIGDRPNTLLVPQVAVGSNQLGKYVYVVGPDNKVDQRFVTVGADYGALVAVSTGVSKGQSVAVGNLLKIGPGSAVKPVAAPQGQQAAAAAGKKP